MITVRRMLAPLFIAGECILYPTDATFEQRALNGKHIEAHRPRGVHQVGI